MINSKDKYIYNKGTPCHKGHLTGRYISSNKCTQCQHDRKIKSKLKNNPNYLIDKENKRKTALIKRQIKELTVADKRAIRADKQRIILDKQTKLKRLYGKAINTGKYKKHYDYLKFLETQVEVLRILNYDGKEIDIYSSNGTWNDVCHHMGHYRRHGNRAYNDAWKMQVAGLNTQEFKKFQNKYKTPKKPKPNRNLSSQK